MPELSARQRARVLEDPWYAEVLTGAGAAALEPAGWFDDGAQPGQRPPVWATTPVHRLAGPDPAADPVRDLVLLSTGGFSPVHVGHLAMMEQARAAAQRAGYRVIGGYLSPGHDGYVSTKHGGDAACPAEVRLVGAAAAVADSDWLMVDPWEARYCAAPVNFTDVIAHLEATLAHLTGRRPQVGYVFGSDNAGFAAAFAHRGVALCVPRPGHPVPDWVRRVAPDRVLVADPGTPALSSSAVRARLAAPAAATPELTVATAGLDYHLRDDLASAAPATVTADRLTAFRRGAVAAFAAALPGATVHVHDVAEQQAFVDALRGTRRVLSLDTATTADATLAVSRLFHLADANLAADRVVARPGTAPLAEQAAALRGRFALVDDDIATGATMAGVRALLPHLDLVEEYSLLAHSAPGVPVFDVVDLRDLLLGARHSGLVVRLPDGSVGRALYAFPYVSPVTRARIPAEAAMAFSATIWALNASLYAGTGVRLADLDQHAASFLYAAGYRPGDDAARVCSEHARRLTELPYAPTVPAAPVDEGHRRAA